MNFSNARCIAKGTYTISAGSYGNVSWNNSDITNNSSYFIISNSSSISVGDVLKDIYKTKYIYPSVLLSIDLSDNVFYSYYGNYTHTNNANPTYNNNTLSFKYPGSTSTIYLALFKIE